MVDEKDYKKIIWLLLDNGDLLLTSKKPISNWIRDNERNFCDRLESKLAMVNFVWNRCGRR